MLHFIVSLMIILYYKSSTKLKKQCLNIVIKIKSASRFRYSMLIYELANENVLFMINNSFDFDICEGLRPKSNANKKVRLCKVIFEF